MIAFGVEASQVSNVYDTNQAAAITTTNASSQFYITELLINPDEQNEALFDINKIVDDNTKLRGENIKFQKEITKLHDDNLKLRDDNTKLREDNLKFQEEITKLHNDFKKFREDITKILVNNSRLQGANDTAPNEFNELGN
ncbi:unnamed protein product [Rotaria sp. Silwood1]|nr:unnamed protein product [Rotaria sp. Silwood1]CAF1504486.1 unnamed protein product [Rotaria sp. Silwood1]CAF1505137.1 unnamed protein product [Rotaria sp. Silwood1]CAF3596877.1 unnamed protein product [Rotaria sp. Silwood1]CAF3626930.1 unnamed protein product [Rotaria sp. Silwood1]